VSCVPKKRSLIIRRYLSLLGPPLGRVILAHLDSLLVALVDHTSSLCAGVVCSLALVRTAVYMLATSRKQDMIYYSRLVCRDALVLELLGLVLLLLLQGVELSVGSARTVLLRLLVLFGVV
jgi:ABC-type spermidine/putrescine transport system permease subunit II